MKNKSLFFFLFITNFIVAQNGTTIKGKIIVSDAKPSEVHVVNLNTEVEVLSDENGFFDIEVHADDLLVFSASHLDYMRKIIEQEDIDKGNFSVAMTSKSTMLDEVEITNYSRINAVSLGILSKPAKKYTVAERRLNAATSSPLDGLLNSISGRKEMLSDDIETEKKEFALKSLDGLYPEGFGGFHYFIVEDFKLKEALKGDNSFLVTFIMIKLAIDYKAIRDAK
jgi:hypothetical protein